MVVVVGGIIYVLFCVTADGRIDGQSVSSLIGLSGGRGFVGDKNYADRI